MEKNKRNKIIGLSLGILIVLIIVVSSTYAYWQITKTQETPNDIVAACLDLNLEDVSAAIDLGSAWPISDEEASNLTGYTFTVTNNCNEEINYIVGLNRVEESNYLQDSSVKVRLDDNSSFTYGDLSNVEYAVSNNTEYTSRVSKQVSVETISANGTNEHTIRVWVSEEAPVTEQSKIFQGQVFITGGQGIEAQECFVIAQDGTLLHYDESCGLEVKVPANIKGIPVKNISHVSFAQLDTIITIAGYGQVTYVSGSPQYENYEYIIYLLDSSYRDKVEQYLKETFCEDPSTCTMEDFSGMYFYESNDDYINHNWEKYKGYDTTGMVYVESSNEMVLVDDLDDSKQFFSHIKGLDLSAAIYLETIGESTFRYSYESDINEGEHCFQTWDSAWNKYYYVCRGPLTSLILPENGVLTTIDSYAFEANQLTELVIPASVETINDAAFKDNRIVDLVFEDTQENPSQLKHLIGDHYGPFSNNNITGKVVIPSSVIEMRYVSPFYDNPNITEFIIKRTEEDVMANTNFANNWNRIGWVVETQTGIDAKITYDPNYTE